MNRISFKLSIALVAGLAPWFASAQTGYLGIAYNSMDYTQEGKFYRDSQLDTSFTSAYFNLAYSFNEYLSTEFRLGLGHEGGRQFFSVDYETKEEKVRLNPETGQPVLDGTGTPIVDEVPLTITTEYEISTAIDYYTGLYVRLGTQLGDSFYPYIIAGATYADIEGSNGRESYSFSQTSPSYGVGFEYQVADTLNLKLEYMNYLNTEGATLNGLSAGITVPF